MVTRYGQADIPREVSGRGRPAVGLAAADFPRDVCLTVSRNHIVFLFYSDLVGSHFESPPFSACRRSFCPPKTDQMLSFYSDLVGFHFELQAAQPYCFLSWVPPRPLVEICRPPWNHGKKTSLSSQCHTYCCPDNPRNKGIIRHKDEMVVICPLYT